MRKITYWCCQHLNDSQAYNIRKRTRKEAVEASKENGEDRFSKPFKVTVTYRNVLGLIDICLGECGVNEMYPIGDDPDESKTCFHCGAQAMPSTYGDDPRCRRHFDV